MWKSLFFLGNPGRKREKPCGMDVADGWKEKRRPVVLHIPVEIRRWNVEKSGKEKRMEALVFHRFCGMWKAYPPGCVKSAVPDIFDDILTMPWFGILFMFFSTCCTAYTTVE